MPIHHPRWRRLLRWLPVVLALLVAGVIAHAARSVDWPQVWRALRHIPPARLLAAAGFASASYACYACTDLFARAHWRGRMPAARAMAIAFVAYAFNQSFGALLGTVGFRLRLYAKAGLDGAAIARIVGLSFLTNWSGYCVLAGVAYASGALQLPPQWSLGTLGLRCVGAALLLAAAAYLALCAGARRRRWQVFGRGFELPPWRMALGQFALSFGIWLGSAAALAALLPGMVPWLAVLSVLLLASIAGLVSHVPGGVGVLEAVFFALLGGQVPHHQLLAALLAYRAVYYLWPLLPALALYLWLEARPAPRSTSGQRAPLNAGANDI